MPDAGQFTVVHVVPRLPPSVCGVGDYALSLSREWRDRAAVDSFFVVADPAWPSQDSVDGFACHKLPTRSTRALEEAMRRAEGRKQPLVMVLQYSGYGFARRGAPVWLARALSRSRSRTGLLTVFHELYADGPPTSSAFWLSWVQRWVTVRLARRSRAMITNRDASARWLANRCPGRDDIRAVPVFSNFGETSAPLPPSQRDNTLSFFPYQSGGSATYWQALRRVVDAANPSRIIALGKKCPLPEWLHARDCEVTGVLPSAAVGAHLRESRVAFVGYDPPFIGKSGVFAACVAHGAATILAEGTDRVAEGLSAGEHLFSCEEFAAAPGLSRMDAVAAAGWSWYQQHRLAATADLCLGMLRTFPVPG